MKIKIIAFLLCSYAIFAQDQNQNGSQDFYSRLAGRPHQVAEALSRPENASSAVRASMTSGSSGLRQRLDNDQIFFMFQHQMMSNMGAMFHSASTANHATSAPVQNGENDEMWRMILNERLRHQHLSLQGAMPIPYEEGLPHALVDIIEPIEVIGIATFQAEQRNQLQAQNEQLRVEITGLQQRHDSVSLDLTQLQDRHVALGKTHDETMLMNNQQRDRINQLEKHSNQISKIVMRCAAGIAMTQVFDVYQRKYHIESGMTRKEANIIMAIERVLLAGGVGWTYLKIDQDLSDIQIPVMTSLSMSLLSILADCFMQPDYEIEFANNAARAKERYFNGKTALMQNDYDLAKIAFAHGADVHARDNDGKTALMHATSTNLIKLLLEKGARLEDKDAQGRTALMHAIEAQNNQQIQRLMDAGADINVSDEHGRTVLTYAVQAKDDAQMEKLISLGVDVHVKDKDGKNLLDYAQSSKAIRLLLAQGLDPRQTQSQAVFLKSALLTQDDDLMGQLIDRGLDINAQDEAGKTALMYLVEDCTEHSWLLSDQIDFKKHIARLLNLGADINGKSKDGKSIFEYARSSDIMLFLLEKGFDIAPVQLQHAVLKKALPFADRSLISLLIEKGMNINVQDKDGKTALMYFVEYSQESDFIEWLIDQGFDVHIKDKFGKTAWDFARSRDRRFTGYGRTDAEAQDHAQRQIDRYQQVVDLLRTGKKRSEQ